jgi:hypothetical protein
MKPNSRPQTPRSGKFVAGPVTRERVHDRTRELALLAGRVPPHVCQDDYEQAKREVTGESEIDRQTAALDS